MFCSLHQIKKTLANQRQKSNPSKIHPIVYPFKGFKLNWTAVEVEPECECNGIGTESKDCKKDTEKCTCKPGYEGAECDQCTKEYWNSSASTGGEFQSTIDLLLFVLGLGVDMGHGASLSSL